jgi:hypothetical protein
MPRRPGYHLEPHRDPKRSLLTCLLYLARPGDSDAQGTQLFAWPMTTMWEPIGKWATGGLKASGYLLHYQPLPAASD